MLPFGPLTGVATGPGRVEATGFIEGLALGFGLVHEVDATVLWTILFDIEGDGHGEGDASGVV